MTAPEKAPDDVCSLPCGIERFNARTIMLHIFTGKDGLSLDLARIMWVITAFAHIGLTVWEAAALKKFDTMAFATGAGVIAGGFGANLLMKAKTEPDAK